ncbi:NAD(P)-binding domain-containing protein [Glaciimonas sp. Gout2]|uniref:flavin-containing monooxygenase n=1 Tax=unclassified Glaciimonas TaxID=2644401 RepID=UPI002B232A51|nr:MULTISPECIES: NAD(P)-binding domain-containing protein [unclassified Glaciimonas]MEB0011224.1 NAD(P)-binding domain-containing protein [Glaciimonas sp. Cout2]MEB0084555.1 NAD(P)-binding domain-containing protein [Glaciimonas sp. Gout2]
MQTASRTAQRVAVIGAGAAGLCAAKHLLARGVDVVVYELGSFIGGLWVYQNDNGLSPAYRSLHLNSEVSITAYKDFPFPKDGPLYPDHFGVSRYLQAYAEKFGVVPHIRFHSKVVDVAAKNGGWQVRLDDDTVEQFTSVVIASGHQGVPKHAAWRHDFAGEYLHSNSYQVPEPFRDKRVLVVGMGNSAVDIASDICVVTKSTTISARSPVLVMPRMLFGVPTSRVLGKIEKRWMPWPMRRTMREMLTRIVHGSMKQWGFVAPKTRTHPTSHPSLMGHFVWNRITAKPGIESVTGNEVRFLDGSVASFDTIIAATGYSVGLPFLTKDAGETEEHKPDLFLRVVSPTQPGLYFVGLFNVAGGGNIRMMDDQAEWLAEMVCGDVDLPDQAGMRAAIKEEQAFLQRHYPASPRYALELDPTFYRKQLAKERKRSLGYRQRVAQRVSIDVVENSVAKSAST